MARKKFQPNFKAVSVTKPTKSKKHKPTYPRKKGEPLLTIEPIPVAAHYINLRTQLEKKDWDKIRRYVYQRADYQCEICGDVGPKHPVEAHELWAWDGKTSTQILTDCRAICPNCHLVKHIGRAQKIGKLDEAFAHLQKVNKWGSPEAFDYISFMANSLAWYHDIPSWKLDILWARELLVEIEEDG